MKKLFLTIASALALMVVAAPPASAADELGLSRNGVTFSRALSAPLFNDSIRWVPGDVRSATFYVRNQGEATARLTVDILAAQANGLLDSGGIRVTARGGGKTHTVSASKRRLLTLTGIDDRKIVPITVTVEFVKGSTNVTQMLSSDLMFRVNLRQTAAVLSDANGDVAPGLLPDTGAPTLWWVAALAAICLGGGSALLLSQRTPTEGASHG